MTTEGYRNKPQFEYNATLNKNITPDVPTFNSNAIDNENMMPLNNCGHCNCSEHKHEHKEQNDHECCHGKHAEGHEHKHCGCDHK